VADNTAVVTAAADIPPSPEGGVAISVLRTDQDNVAVGHIEYQPKPVPFFKIKREMAVYGGFGTDGVIAGIAVRPVRIGPIEIVGRGEIAMGDSTDVRAAILAEWKF
jgi:hypothetical protein